MDLTQIFTWPPTPAKWRALKDYLASQRLIPGNGVRLSKSTVGVIVNSSPSDKGTPILSSGPFCKMFTETSGATKTSKLLGGVVSGGEGNVTIADVTLATVGSEPADGTFLWLTISFTANTEDGVLLPGGDVTAATTGSGTTLPDNTTPTAAAPAGTLYVSLGSWSQGSFNPSACGDVLVSHCPGSLSSSR